MTDLSAILVIPFYGKSDEWPIWSEKFLAKAKRYGFKGVLFGKVTIPKTDVVFNFESEEGKKMMMAADLNETAYTELILSIDDKTSGGKVAFNLVKACKTKDYVDGNAFMALERLKKLLRILLYSADNSKENVEIVGLLDIRHKIAKIKLNKMAQTKEIRKMAPTALIVEGQNI